MTTYDYDSEIFSFEIKRQTAILSPQEKAFKVSLDGSYMNEFIECLSKIEVDNNIKGILILDTAEYQGVKNIQRFIGNICKEEFSYVKEKTVARYGNAAKHLTLSLNNFSKPIVVGVQGDIPIDSFGFYMACDYCISSKDMKIKFPGMDFGITPTGAVTYFLNKEIGVRKTLDLFLSGADINSDIAHKLTIVDKLVDAKNLESECLDHLESYYHQPELMLSMIKQLIKVKNYEIEEHFEHSTRLLWNAVLVHTPKCSSTQAIE